MLHIHTHTSYTYTYTHHNQPEIFPSKIVSSPFFFGSETPFESTVTRSEGSPLKALAESNEILGKVLAVPMPEDPVKECQPSKIVALYKVRVRVGVIHRRTLGCVKVESMRSWLYWHCKVGINVWHELTCLFWVSVWVGGCVKALMPRSWTSFCPDTVIIPNTYVYIPQGKKVSASIFFGSCVIFFAKRWQAKRLLQSLTRFGSKGSFDSFVSFQVFCWCHWDFGGDMSIGQSSPARRGKPLPMSWVFLSEKPTLRMLLGVRWVKMGEAGGWWGNSRSPWWEHIVRSYTILRENGGLHMSNFWDILHCMDLLMSEYTWTISRILLGVGSYRGANDSHVAAADDSTTTMTFL